MGASLFAESRRDVRTSRHLQSSLRDSIVLSSQSDPTMKRQTILALSRRDADQPRNTYESRDSPGATALRAVLSRGKHSGTALLTEQWHTVHLQPCVAPGSIRLAASVATTWLFLTMSNSIRRMARISSAQVAAHPKTWCSPHPRTPSGRARSSLRGKESRTPPARANGGGANSWLRPSKPPHGQDRDPTT